jgi:homopolymeric O-antigen transport system permease protein
MNTLLMNYNPWTICKSLWQKRYLLYQLIRYNIYIRYRGTVIGTLWMLGMPIALLFVYTFSLMYVFKASWQHSLAENSTLKVLIIDVFCGLSIYTIFAECTSNAINSIIQNVSFVKKIIFPLEILPVAATVSSIIFGIMWLIILALAALILLGSPILDLLLVLIIVLPFFIFCFGISWLVAAICVYIQDFKHIIDLGLRMLLFLTPIFYKTSSLSGVTKTIIKCNPLTCMIDNIRLIIINKTSPDWGEIVIFTIIAMVVFCFGHMVFMKAKDGFCDVI